MHIFRHIFLGSYWWQESDIWSQASYMYAILWEAFLDPSDSYFLFADLVGFYTHWTYMHIFRHIFLSSYWWQESDIWSQASYMYAILWEAFLDPSDSYFLFADLVGFYTHWTYMHIFRHIFLSSYWWQESDIWSQASYMYAILWEAFLDPSDSYFLFADLVGFYTHWTYMHIFRHIFLSSYWWQESDIWSQASYMYAILWEAFLDPSDSYFLFADLVGFYTHWTYMHIFRHIFLSSYWWQESDIWSQASYMYAILWEAFLDPSDSYFLFADLVGFYTHWTYMHIFRHIFLSSYWWQESDIWSQASYMYAILWEAFLDPSDSYFLFADLVGFYTHWTYMHIFRHIFLSSYWWQESDIWSQASYMYAILWEAFLDPSDSYFLFADLVSFYTHWTYMHIFRHIFLSSYWWQESDIWSQASYMYAILWEAFLDPSDSYFLFADLVGFYTHWTYMHIFRHIFLSSYWWQESDIWSQASYMYAILWEAFLDPSDSYFLFADLVGFYTHWTYMHIFRHIFHSSYWWQESDIWSQASYMYAILWEAFLDPSDFYFLFADLVGFYTHWTYMHIFRHIFLSSYWWQESDIWSQASYMYAILWEAFLDPSDSYFLFANLVGFYTHWTYMHIFRHIFLSSYWWQESDICSQASYMYAILWEAFLDPSDSYFLFADLVSFYTHWTYMHIFRHIFLTFLDPSDSYFLFADLVGFYTHWTYMLIFRHIFLSSYWWQESDIWSQASYMYAILWEAFLDPSDSYFLFADLVGFYTHWTYMHIFRHIFLSSYWWQESDIWSQASYMYAILWEAFLDPSDSYFLFADLVGFYTHWTYMHIFRHIFLSSYWWQESDIWSQASYMYAILWEAFLDPSDSYFLFADLVGFYTHWTYMHIFRHIFLSSYWWQESDIWSQASYMYAILWEAFLDPSDSYFLFADLVGFYTHWTYMHIFRHIFLSSYWWQESDIWSQASYMYAILWEAFLDPSDSYFLFADLVGFYTHWTYMHIFRHIFLSSYWWQESDIWSQASYMYAILWEAFLDPSDSYFLFADLVGFYTHWTYMHIFRHIFLSSYWWQESDIWSQASYMYAILWEAFLDPSDSYFLFADLVGFLHITYMHIFRHILQLLMTGIWYLVTSFIYVCHIVGSVFGPVRFLLPVCRLSWFLYTLNIYAHFSSHFSQQLLMTGIWYLVTSFIYVCHIVGSVFGPVRFLLPVCRLSWFLYTLNIYAHFSSHFSQQLLMTGIWYLVTSFIYVCHIVGSVFGSVRFLLPVCQLSWFLYTLNIYAHFSSHFSQQLLMTGIWYLFTSFIYVCHIVGSVFGPVRFLLPVCRLS